MSNPSPVSDPGRPDEAGTALSAGIPGPSGTGEQTEAGADPDAPTAAPTDAQEHA